MRSMTGYGAGQVETKDVKINLHMRCVNGRFLEIRCHLPREYMPFENEIKKILAPYLGRGTVDFVVNRKVRGKHNLHLNRSLSEQWHKELKNLSQEWKVPKETLLSQIFSVPGFFSVEESLEVTPSEKEDFFKCLTKAAKTCEAEKRREGAFLKKDLQELLKGLQKSHKEMMVLRQRANAALAEKAETRLKTFFSTVTFDAGRLAQEVAFLIDKADISEELTRLEEHVKFCLEQLKVPNGQGKKLDFYAQELLREINTIGSKSQFAELTHQVVEAKSIVERFREQIQNVE